MNWDFTFRANAIYAVWRDAVDSVPYGKNTRGNSLGIMQICVGDAVHSVPPDNINAI
jgi:hypothetical protein